MTGTSETDAMSDQTSWDIPKVRSCLKCKATFHSAWSGERVCARCKKSNVWQGGGRLKSFPTRNSR